MVTRSTHTLAELPLSAAAYAEIAAALRAADYGHAFLHEGRIDMSGIAVFARAIKADVPKYVTASVESLTVERTAAYVGAVTVKTRHLDALLKWVAKQITDGALACQK